MYPYLLNWVPLYFVMWLCAAAVGIGAGTHVAVRAGFPAGRSAVALSLLAMSILVGSKLLYLAEAHWFPFDDYVPFEMRAAQHGFRIPGGVLMLAMVIPAVCRALGFDWRRFGDAVIPMAALALVFIRLGCLLNGCCFGKRSFLPWAMRFPRGSWAFWYHATHGWVAPSAQWSQPVHPLQLYFLLVALFLLAVAWLQLVGEAPMFGCVQLTFYLLFFGATAILEPLRENYLTLNHWVAAMAAGVSGAVLVLWFRPTDSLRPADLAVVDWGAMRGGNTPEGAYRPSDHGQR